MMKALESSILSMRIRQLTLDIILYFLFALAWAFVCRPFRLNEIHFANLYALFISAKFNNLKGMLAAF